MKTTGRHSRVSNIIKPSDQAQEYDVDHEITATINEIDDIISSCDFGPTVPFRCNNDQNEKLIIKACINHLLEKL